MSERDQVAPGNVGTQATTLVRANSEDAGQLGVGKEQQEICSKEEVRSKKSAMHRFFHRSLKHFDSFGQAQTLFVGAVEDRVLARLLLENRSFGYPGTDGRIFSNYIAYLLNRHPVLSIFTCHPHHPFTSTERVVVLWCSIFWAFFTNTIMEFYTRGQNPSNGTGSYLAYITILALLVIPYEILIRVVIICPCCLHSELEATEVEEASKKHKTRSALKNWGRILLATLVIMSVIWFTVGMLTAIGLHKTGFDGKRQKGDDVYSLDEAALLLLMVKAWQLGPMWCLQWTPVFLLWYNRDKSAWLAAHPDEGQSNRLCCVPTEACPAWKYEGTGTRASASCCGLCRRLSFCFDWLEKRVLSVCPCSPTCWPCGILGPCAPLQKATGWGCLRCGDDDGTGGGFDRARQEVP